MTPRRLALGVVVLTKLALGNLHGQALDGAGARQPQPVFRADVTAVRVDVSVTRGGAPVSGLAADDFEIRDNGVPQRIEALFVDEVPLSASLVLDTSGSVAGEPLADLRRAASAFLDGLRTNDRAALVTFSHAVTLREAPTPDIARVAAALARVEASGATALNDAVYVTLRLREPAADRAVAVVFSDGIDNLSWLSDRDVVTAARRSDVIVYGVTLTREPEKPPDRTFSSEVDRAQPRDNVLLKELADQTGGRVWWAGSSRELAGLFVRALEEIRARYVLTYYPTGVDEGGWHTLDVKLKRARGEVRARPGYDTGHDR